jgi:uncharacterized membrane protein
LASEPLEAAASYRRPSAGYAVAFHLHAHASDLAIQEVVMQSTDLEYATGRSWAGFLAGAGLGAVVMYLIDPNNGARRRALVRDKAVHAAHKTMDGLDAAGRDVAHRAYGTWASARRRIEPGEVSDRVLVERVRSKLGRYVSHPHAVEVHADCGYVTLSGKILRGEAAAFLRALEHMPGVRRINSQLEQHETRDSIPSLQGGRPRPGEPLDVFQKNWSPATRALMGGVGSALAAYGALRRNTAGTLAWITGAGCVLRAATNFETQQTPGIGVGRRAVDIEKTITINAPIARVFDFWNRLENFPHFTKNILDVKPAAAEGQYHWRIAGPGRVPVEFDVTVTRFEPNRLLAWRTVDGSAVAHAGVIHFEPDEGGGTRVHIQFSYNLPGGPMGQAIAALFGSDPKAKMNADLARMKQTIETGTPPRDTAPPVPESPQASNERQLL